MLRATGLSKGFTLHLQGGLRIPVLAGIDLAVRAGECVALGGPSGAGKTTLLRCLYGNYRADGGTIEVMHRGAWTPLSADDPRTVLDIRAQTIGYVSQFLRAVPRVPAISVVADAAQTADGRARHAQAEALLTRLNIPHALHGVAPATFSGGEQQRVNLARGFIGGHPILLLDEPTASLDPANRDVVIELIREAKSRGVAIVGIFHDTAVRDAVADRVFPVTPLRDAA
ncbi:MAG TPA: phosphonate C-P lyase system protein PhnL [Acidisphaera sp.]|nr:phosphonate C-P lyase system protein PhnL [Acidisphaera sp.]